MPLCEGPSLPVTPARSSTRVTAWPCRATSISSWSKARLRNVEYTATTGCNPPRASPAAAVSACCSAMPTSRQRSGNAAANGARPVGPSIAAVIATTSGRREPSATISVANTLVQPIEGGPVGSPVSGSKAAGLCICSASSFSAGG